jgi:hypothetical protein
LKPSTTEGIERTLSAIEKRISSLLIKSLIGTVDEVPISDFINKELILFSMADNVRSIPSVVDGFKPESCPTCGSGAEKMGAVSVCAEVRLNQGRSRRSP